MTFPDDSAVGDLFLSFDGSESMALKSFVDGGSAVFYTDGEREETISYEEVFYSYYNKTARDRRLKKGRVSPNPTPRAFGFQP